MSDNFQFSDDDNPSNEANLPPTLNAYDILGVNPDTPMKVIKKNWKELAKLYHPDKHPNEIDKYDKIWKVYNKSYEILKQKHQQKQTNQNRDESTKKSDIIPQNSNEIKDMFDDLSDDNDCETKDDCFKYDETKSRPIFHDFYISLKDAYYGVKRRVNVEIIKICSLCNAKPVITESFGLRCIKCGGNGITKKREWVTVPIKKGVRQSETIQMKGRGNQFPDHKRGDLIFVIHIQSDEWERKGHDVFFAGIIYLDGKTRFKCKYNKKTWKCIKGKGMAKNRYQRGNLYVPPGFELV
mmetsp:Transcript_56299/g.68830  ORF Transcript_56299/g.68830 Transcript_56299/m.68830 type:complete len:296 (+) Transcript_56299:33-920(+)